MKIQIEISCVEDDLLSALFEVKQVMLATNLISMEIKVFHDKNTYSWMTVTKESSPHELVQIHELKKKIAELSDELESLKA